MIPSAPHPSSHSREEVLAAISRTFLIPVVRVESQQQAVCAAEGVVLAGHPVIEMTLTVPGALKIIEDLAARYWDDLFVGAGTVLDVDTCRSAMSAGARFIVSPSINPRVIEFARASGILCMPGALSPTEVDVAWQAGADLIKIFPAGMVGGPGYIRALKAPFPQIEFVPSGGVSTSNIAEYKSARATAICMGELIFERTALREGRTDIIAANVARFVTAIRDCEPAPLP